jgi:uncharacterized protein (DUF433 family)
MQKPDYLPDEQFAIAVLGRSGPERRGIVVSSGHTVDPDEHDPERDLAHHAPSEWQTVIKSASERSVRLEEWFAECISWGHKALENAVDVDSKRRGGIPVLKGTRFTVGQTLAELSESAGVPEVAERFDLDEATIRELLAGLALLAERPCR